MGFWSNVREFFSHPVESLFGGGGDQPPSEPPTDFASPGDDDLPGGSGESYDWQIAGQLPAGSTYDQGYQNYDPDSPEARFSVEPFPGWGFLPDADYVVVKVTINGETYYTTLAGPFDDLDDLEAAIADWWESGS